MESFFEVCNDIWSVDYQRLCSTIEIDDLSDYFFSLINSDFYPDVFFVKQKFVSLGSIG